VLADPGFVSGLDLVVVVVDSVQVISSTGCAVLGWRYDWGKRRGERQAETETAVSAATWFTGTWQVQTTTV
jgi:hypothetical protein